ncbi:sigma-54-dependent transcriptional regulator [Motiliproteus sediminis]|uniref:sigma-54-dependent transcriptional regulator n=1 Tax=Motiliproteus sediminis TaxID=1468178 RepID=UPI001AEFE66B|nr:sigma-54 dependent transcriptional regulator [Motiliproteus sediminis]
MTTESQTAKGRVLVVEDDAELREALCDTLELAGYEYRQADSGEAALALLEEQPVEMVVSDVNMGGMDGHALLAQLQQRYPALPVLLITAYGQVDRAVDAIRNGAVDYLLKPFEPEQLLQIVARYVDSALQRGDGDEPVAEEPSSQQLLQLARRVAETDSTVLILGESGTGKEVLAQYIHRHSARADKPFVAINCAAIPENMLEATLFGHEKGSFTGAYASAPGKFEQANGGTLLLDEISEMDIGLQAKLLRVLQEQEVERIGGRRVIKLDVRVLATTNRDLAQCVAEGRFREDLYYRLNIFPLQWLPLRERPADLVPLAKRLLAHHARKMNRGTVELDPAAAQLLLQHNWPGNVRELENAVQRALILQQGNLVKAQDLCIQPSRVQQSVNLGGLVLPEAPAAPATAPQLGDDLRQHEFQLIIEALRGTGGSRKDAAEKLGISPRTLRYKLAQMRESGLDLDALLKG